MIAKLIGTMYVNAHHAQRDQQRQRSLRPIRGRAESIQPKDRNAGDGPMCSARSSEVASGLPTTKSKNDTQSPVVAVKEQRQPEKQIIQKVISKA